MRELVLVLSAAILVAVLITTARMNKRVLFEKYMTEDTPPDIGCSIDADQINEGREYLKTKKLIIAGLCRDSADNIDTMKENVAKIGKLFGDYRVLIVENDSEDDTRKELIDWSLNDPRVTILGCGVNATSCKMNLHKTVIHGKDRKRINKMVLLRNIYLNYISTLKDEDYDFVAVYDLDIVGALYSDGISTSGYWFKSRPDINCLCANGYKINAFGPFTTTTYADPYAHSEQGRVNQSIRNLWLMEPERCDIAEAKKVISCFNGFSIYRKEALDGKKYSLEMSGKNAKCEHNTINQSVGGVYMNPSMLFVILKQ